MKEKLPLTSILILLAAVGTAPALFALEKKVDIYLLNDKASQHGIGEKIGTLTLKDSDEGLVIKPHLKNLPTGDHGFHIHQNPSCEGGEENHEWKKGLAAGSHYDPDNTHQHLGPYHEGHRGDLPVLVVDKQGESTQQVLAPRLKLADVVDHSVVIHEGADNYSDNPPLGGGGDRIACGVIR